MGKKNKKFQAMKNLKMIIVMFALVCSSAYFVSCEKNAEASPAGMGDAGSSSTGSEMRLPAGQVDEEGGTVRFYIRSAFDAPIAGAKVTLFQRTRRYTPVDAFYQTAKTGRNGVAGFKDVPDGRYSYTVEAVVNRIVIRRSGVVEVQNMQVSRVFITLARTTEDTR
jgi:hypothetical protein